jgi:hypothetical protein
MQFFDSYSKMNIVLKINVIIVTSYLMCEVFGFELNNEILDDFTIDDTILLSVNSECTLKLKNDQNYKTCNDEVMLLFNTSKVEQSRNQIHCCLSWSLIDCFETFLNKLCPKVEFEVSRDEWIKVVEQRHQCDDYAYESRIHKCFANSVERKSLIPMGWKIFLIVILVCAFVSIIVLLRKRSQHRFQSIPVRMSFQEFLPARERLDHF